MSNTHRFVKSKLVQTDIVPRICEYPKCAGVYYKHDEICSRGSWNAAHNYRYYDAPRDKHSTVSSDSVPHLLCHTTN